MLAPPDNPYGLPNATQTGANVFACRINGKNYVVKPSIYTFNAGIWNDTLGITVSAGLTYFERFFINLYTTLQQGNLYSLGDSTKGSVFYIADSSCISAGSRNSVIKSKLISGNLMLTRLDRVNKIFSGTFNCRIPIPQCNTMNVTDGRFDAKYY